MERSTAAPSERHTRQLGAVRISFMQQPAGMQLACRSSKITIFEGYAR